MIKGFHLYLHDSFPCLGLSQMNRNLHTELKPVIHSKNATKEDKKNIYFF